MNKLLKRAAALLLSGIMALGFAAGAMAVDPTPTPLPTPAPGGKIYITAYAGPTNGRTILEYRDGDSTNVKERANGNHVYLTIYDSRVTSEMGALIAAQDNPGDYITAKTASSDFTANWSVIKDSIYDVTYTNGALIYTIRTTDLEWYGQGTNLSVDIFYNYTKLKEKKLETDPAFAGFSELEIASVSQQLSGFGTKNIISSPEATPTPTPTPTPEPTTRTSGLIIRATSIGGTTVEAGDEFTLTLEVYATASGTENLCDVLVAINPAEGVTLASGSSTKYIGTMSPGTATSVQFPMHAQNNFTGGTSTVSVSLSANGEKSGASAQATGTNVTVPVIQPERFEISKLEIPNPITVGEENFCTITFVNKGKNALNNLTITMQGTNLQEEEQSEYVGNLAAGTEKSVDFNLCALEPGQVTGVIALEYEDASGQQVVMTQNFGTNVEEPYNWDPWMDPGMDEPLPEEKSGLPVWAYALIAAAVVVAGAGGFFFLKKRRAKAAAAEGEDADF